MIYTKCFWHEKGNNKNTGGNNIYGLLRVKY